MRAVIKHRAPNGALRLKSEALVDLVQRVIKHRAPNGALRLGGFSYNTDVTKGVIKHRAPNGALRLAPEPPM